jgi:signal transduction histidine kinase
MTFQDQPLHNALHQQQSLREIIESISSELELRPLLTRIVRHACELLDAENGTIGLVDETRNVIRTEAVYRMPPDELGAEMPPGVGLAGRVFLTGQPVVLNQYGEVEKPLQMGLLQYAVIGMPIFWRDQMIGFFGLGSPPPRCFTAQDIESLSLFAKHAAIAIINARLFEETQSALSEMQVLYETSRRISTAIDVVEVIAAYLDQVATRGRFACTIVLYEKDAQGQKSAVLVRGRWTPTEGRSLAEIRVPYTHDALDPLLDAGQTVLIRNVHTDSRVTETLREIQRQSRRPALAMVPLMVRGERIGLVILSYPFEYIWTEADIRLYQATAAQLATAIDSRQQVQLLYERGQQLAVLEERQRLARDLHDSVTQLLFGITLVAQSLSAAWQRSPEEAEKRVARLLELSKAACAELRALLAELRPAASEAIIPSAQSAGILSVRQHGLIEGLRIHVGRMNLDGIEVIWDVADYARQAQEIEETFFRIAQEALANSFKHARARKITIRLTTQTRTATLVVQDDGVGFLPSGGEAASKTLKPDGSGMGLMSMRERVEALGGTFWIDSNPGSGTTVEAHLPKKEGTTCREFVS